MRMGVKNLSVFVRMNMNQIGVQQEIPVVEHFLCGSLTCHAVLLVKDDAAG